MIGLASRRRRSRHLRRDDHATGLFVVETRDVRGRWIIRSTYRTLYAAQEGAWKLLAQTGVMRVRQGASILVEGERPFHVP